MRSKPRTESLRHSAIAAARLWCGTRATTLTSAYSMATSFVIRKEVTNPESQRRGEHNDELGRNMDELSATRKTGPQVVGRPTPLVTAANW
jgi:hypothetical protein